MAMSAATRGTISFTRDSSLRLPMSQAMKRHSPTGGVLWPMAREITMMMPKNRGSIPRLMMMG